MNIRPLHDRVLLRRLDSEFKSAGGIIIPDTAQEKPSEGEVLAVGDAEFQRRCLGKMGEVARGGRTVLFVSHNMAAVGNLCERGIDVDRDALQSEIAAQAVAFFDQYIG